MQIGITEDEDLATGWIANLVTAIKATVRGRSNSIGVVRNRYCTDGLREMRNSPNCEQNPEYKSIQMVNFISGSIVSTKYTLKYAPTWTNTH